MKDHYSCLEDRRGVNLMIGEAIFSYCTQKYFSQRV